MPNGRVRNHLRACPHQRVTRFNATAGHQRSQTLPPGAASAILTHKKIHVARAPFGDFGLMAGMSNTPRRP
jgi:hypothetical protein